jgi:hypothetical protein
MQSKVWFTGWDKPRDSVGDCRFRREGDRLTITVPGRGHTVDFFDGRPNVPCLLRDVAGDFVVQVRVKGTFWPSNEIRGCHRAGLVLLGAKDDSMLRLQVVCWYLREPGEEKEHPEDIACNWTNPRGQGSGFFVEGGASRGSHVFLRLVRRENEFQSAYSIDGKNWVPLGDPGEDRVQLQKFPKRLKVGVVAESDATRPLTATFDRFQLTQ